MSSAIDRTRLRISAQTDAKKKSRLGQYMTPGSTAWFMANLFPPCSNPICRLLDPGAGIGSLSEAFIERWLNGGFDFSSMEITVCEIDDALRFELGKTLALFESLLPITTKVVPGDFIEEAVYRLQFKYGMDFTHSILNPPYKKIDSNSRHRQVLRLVGIETVNLYSAFVALTLALMAQGGLVVAIIPRSFCNGPYYRPFREFMLTRSAIHHIHLFASRNKAFKDDDVLQENVIILLERGGQQGDVKISTSTDDSFSDLVTTTHPFNRIVFPDDPEGFIHVPTSSERNAMELSPAIQYSLDDIGVQVSTGPVVDFRVKEHVRYIPEPGTIPLLYPSHFIGYTTTWPKLKMKNPNAIHRNALTEKWLYPTGYYCVVRRLSSKEEKRRIIAGVVEPQVFADAPMLGFENHLNVFHNGKRSLPEALARGLAVFLNTTAVDELFRRFNGHTQVNATDLRLLKYPSRENLIALGEWAILQSELTQEMINTKVENLNI